MFAKQITDTNKFNQVVSDAIESVAINATSEKEGLLWLKGIDRAVEMIESQGEFMSYDLDKKELTIWSQTSNNVYVANGSCGCEAYLRGNGRCKHRIAAKLFKNYFGLDGETRPQEAEVAANITSPLSITEKFVNYGHGLVKETRIGGFRI